MPVKVRCPTCEKILNAPETARGKAVKCPGCETKVKVPAGGGNDGDVGAVPSGKRSTKKPSQKSLDSDDVDFLADLDLDKVADSSQAMCPKCGASIPEEATECPKCGVDPATGQLSARAKKRKGMKGPDPALFYGAAWTDSWAFLKENFSVAIRTAVYFIVASVVGNGCQFMVGYCTTMPPKVFWLAMNLAAQLAWLGWPWHLVIETIRTTVGRKSDIRRIHFDAFLCMALGIKWILWCIAFCVWFPPAFLMYPLAMIHMAMPVTKRAWINMSMFSTFFKNFGPTMYFWAIWLATGLIALITPFIGGVILALAFGSKMNEFMQDRLAQKPPSGATDWIIMSLLIVISIAFSLVYGMVEVFKARVIGLMAFYFKDTLDLVVIIAEKGYQRREVKVDVWGVPIKTTQQKVLEALLVVGVLLLVAGVGYAVYYMLFKGG